MNKWKFALASILLLALTSAFALAQATSASGASTSGQATATQAQKEKAEHAKLDINTATKEELSALPGIGDVYSQKIIDNRPYRAKNELVSKNVVPQATYDKIKDQIVAHQMKEHKTHAKKEKATETKP